MNALEKFIIDFQAKAIKKGSKHYVTKEYIANGWHSDTIIQACIDEFGEEGIMADEGIVNDKIIARDAKEFLVQQIKEKI
jgi:hypothetical protein|tara:strand:+ start:1035 stop:1274 length:240 start_codon:yes stop_codon:yes gene_type:complete